MNLFEHPEIGMMMVLIGILFFWLAYRKPVWAVCGVLLCLPTYLFKTSFGGLPFNLLDVLIWSTFFGTAFHIRFKFRWHSWWYACFFFIAAGIFGVLVAPDLAEALGQFKSVVLEPVLLFVLMVTVIKSEQDQRVIINSLLCLALVVGLVTLGQYFTGYGIPEPWHAFSVRRATAWYGYPNAVGLLLAPIFALALGKSIFTHTRQPLDFWLAFLTAAVIPGAAWAAHTDGAFIAIAASVLWMGVWTRWRWWWIGGAMVTLIIGLLIPAVREVLFFQDISGDVRRALWIGTWNVLEARPFAGTGLAGFPFWYDQYRLPSHVELLRYSHNIIFDFWTQMTVLGLIAWVWIEYRFFRLARPLKNVFNHPTALWTTTAMVAIVVYGLVDVPYFKNDLAVLFWTIIALAVSGRRWTNRQKNATLE